VGLQGREPRRTPSQGPRPLHASSTFGPTRTHRVIITKSCGPADKEKA
jgi:hypothetical protein